jgi:hypothetical protein
MIQNIIGSKHAATRTLKGAIGECIQLNKYGTASIADQAQSPMPYTALPRNSFRFRVILTLYNKGQKINGKVSSLSDSQTEM